MVDQVLRHAANPITAGLGVGSVRIVDNHPSGRAWGICHYQNAIRAHSFSAIAEPARRWRVDIHSAGTAIEYDEVIAQSVVLEEFLSHRAYDFLAFSPGSGSAPGGLATGESSSGFSAGMLAARRISALTAFSSALARW